MLKYLPAILAAVFLIGCHSEPAPPRQVPEPAPQRVEVAPVSVTTRPAIEAVIGSIAPRVKPIVSAKVGGTVTTVRAEVGDRIRRGDLLVQIEAREIQARLDQALPQLERARQDGARFASLLESNAITQQQVDEVQARIRTMEATVEEARTLLSYTTVTAPIDAIIRARRVDVGDFASPGRPLFELEGVADFRFEAAIPESLSGRLRIGDEAPVRIDANGTTIKGRLAEITPSTDPISRTFIARYDLATSETLVSGQFGRLMLPLGEINELTVPRKAVVLRGQLEIVFVADSERARLRIVRTGRLDAREATILSGLQPGEKVVASGADRLEDNQRIEVVP